MSYTESESPAYIYKDESRRQIAIVCLSSIISTFDFTVYIFLAEAIHEAFFFKTESAVINHIQVLSIISVGYISRPIGAVLLGGYGDLHGRQPALAISLLFLTMTTLLTAFLPTFSQIGFTATALFFTARFLQGMAFGAAIPLGWVFVAEHVKTRNLASYCSLVASSIIVGTLFAVIFFRVLHDTLAYQDIISFGWRLPFIVGGIISLIAFVLCRRLTNTPEFLDAKDANLSSATYLRHILQFNRPYRILLATASAFVIASLVMIVVLLLPQLIKLNFAIDVSLLTFANILGLLFMIIGCIFLGTLADKIGMGKVLFFASLALIIQTLLFYSHLMFGSGSYILIFYALLGFFSGIVGLCLTIITKIFPVNIRALSASFIYNIMFAICGAAIPFGLFYAANFINFAPALYLVLVGIISAGIGIYLINKPYDYIVSD